MVVTDEERRAVRRLYDQMQMEQAAFWWTHNIDRGRPQDALKYFSDDCVVDYGVSPDGPMHGKDTYLAFMSESFLPTPPGPDSLHGLRVSFCFHHATNFQVDFITDDEAVAEWHSIGVTERPDGRRGMGWSKFVDRFVRKPDGWWIVERNRTSTARQRLAPAATALLPPADEGATGDRFDLRPLANGRDHDDRRAAAASRVAGPQRDPARGHHVGEERRPR